MLNNPDILRGFVNLALEVNPAGPLVPAGSGNPMESIAEEKGKIEKMMRENRKAYDKDDKVQERYRELIDAENKMKGRAA